MFQFWFNTFFVSGLTPMPSEGESSMMTKHFPSNKQDELGATSWFELRKEDLDKANKDKKNKIYSPNFKVRCDDVCGATFSLLKAESNEDEN